MCGITGYISFQGSITADQLVDATTLLTHRGPDAAGFYFSDDKTLGLGHRRLSILDLSTSANQPMHSHDGRYVIVFNGEVYNFRELRRRLPGVQFNTTSDTEVILELFARYGVEAFNEMNGMFALCIYDKQKEVVTFGRDHAGIKPLFLYIHDHELIFSSEIKSIKKIKGDQLKINADAVAEFLHLGFIPHPHTIYEEVVKFPAGHYLEIDLSRKSLGGALQGVKPFWQPAQVFSGKPASNMAEKKKEFTSLLTNTIEQQLISDVAIGTFLSGGIDSSLVTAVAARVSREKVNTYSIAIDNGKYNEAPYASAVAKALETNHYEFPVKEKDVLELINNLIPAYDEPFADSSAFPTMMVSRLAKNHVTVALSGDGGDELFMGYGAYQWADRLNNKLVKAIRNPLHGLSQLMSDKYIRAGKMFSYPSQENIKSHIFSQEQYFFSETELKSLLKTSPAAMNSLNSNVCTGRQLDAVESQAFWDFRYYLPDDLLVKVDRASMQYSLEVRVPLLDYRIIEFAFNLHRDLKMRNGEMKYFLKQVLYDFLPKKLFERPKWGFSIPLKRWLKSELLWLLTQYTSREVIEKHGFLNYSSASEITKKYLDGQDYLFNRVWAIIVLHWWLEEQDL